MACTGNPSIVLVHGAWHRPEHYQLLTDRLSKAGFNIEAVHLPSTGAEKTMDSMDPDIEAIRDTIEAIVNRGEDVVVICHSYGGCPSGDATQGFLKKDREQQGLKGGVVTMVYMCAFAPDVGQCSADLVEKAMSLNRVAEGMVMVDKPQELFYNMVDPDIAKEAVSKLQHQCAAPFFSKVAFAPWKHIPCTYILCEQDLCWGHGPQERMTDPKRGGKWTVKKLDAGHSPFLSVPDKTCNIVQEAIADVYT